MDRVYEETEPDKVIREEKVYRHSMLSKSAVCQQAIAHPCITSTLFPLLGGESNFNNEKLTKYPFNHLIQTLNL